MSFISEASNFAKTYGFSALFSRIDGELIVIFVDRDLNESSALTEKQFKEMSKEYQEFLAEGN